MNSGDYIKTVMRKLKNPGKLQLRGRIEGLYLSGVPLEYLARKYEYNYSSGDNLYKGKDVINMINNIENIEHIDYLEVHNSEMMLLINLVRSDSNSEKIITEFNKMSKNRYDMMALALIGDNNYNNLERNEILWNTLLKNYKTNRLNKLINYMTSDVDVKVEEIVPFYSTIMEGKGKSYGWTWLIAILLIVVILAVYLNHRYKIISKIINATDGILSSTSQKR